MLAQRLACSPVANMHPIGLLSQPRCKASSASKDSSRRFWTVTCTHTHTQCTREVHACRRTSHRGTCYVSAGCSASELNLGTEQYLVHVQHFAASCDGGQVSKVPGRRFSRDPGLTELPLRLPAFSTVHHYVLAASLTGPVMHCAIWGLRHKLDQEQHRTVCAGPARARFGSIAWPSDKILEVGRKDQGPVIAPRSPASCYILPIVSHMIAAGRSPHLRSSLSGSGLVCFSGCVVPGCCFCASLPVLLLSALLGVTQGEQKAKIL